jgi:transposase-like protein
MLVNEATRHERGQFFKAEPYERTDAGIGYSNCYKSKSLNSRIGPITFDVTQICGGPDFYPSALDKGILSEQALKFVLAEMYVQGMTTR